MTDDLQEEDVQGMEPHTDPRGPQMRASKRTSAMLESDEEEDVDIGSPDAPEPDEQPPAKRQATQAAVEAPRFQKVQPGTGQGRAGQVKTIRVENFMCHEHLKVEFKPSVNFISGTNGSGKSATLQALQFCLGVAARHTGRGHGAKDLIKYGARQLVACVTLWNTGSDAYMPGYYGPTITIERKASAAGASTYTIYDHSGRKVSTGPKAGKDAASVRDHFNIDANNPAMCLTQDTARTFSGSTGASGKYVMYMAATQFDRIIINLNDSKHKLEAMDDNIAKAEDDNEANQEKLEELARQLEAAAELRVWSERAHLVRNCKTWSPVLIARAAAAGIANQLAFTLPQYATAAQEEMALAIQEVETEQSSHDRQMVIMSGFNDASAALAAEKEQLKAQHREAGHSHAKARKQLASIDSAMQEAEAVAQGQQQAIDEAQEKLAANSQSVKEAEAMKAKKEEQSRTMEATLKDHEGEKQSLQARLRDLKSYGDTPMKAFGGDAVIQLLNKIRQNPRQFKHPPIGPIGSVLSLRNDMWARAVEASIGGFFNNFIVDNDADSRTLSKMAQQCRLRIRILKYSFSIPRHDLGKHQQAPPSVLTVERLLRFKETGQRADTVYNVLVDQRRIEAQALVQGAVEGLKLVRSDRAMAGAWAADGTNIYVRGMTDTQLPYYERTAPRLAGDHRGAMRELQDNLKEAEQRVQQAKSHFAAARAQEQEAAKALSRAWKERKEAEGFVREVQTQTKELTSQMYEAEATQVDDVDMATLVEELQEAKMRLQEAKRQREEEVAKVEERRAAEQAAQTAFREKQEEGKRLVNDNAANQEAMQEAEARLQEKQEAVPAIQARLDKINGMVTKATKEQEEFENSVRFHTEEALQGCTEEVAEASLEQLQKLDKKLPEDLNERMEYLTKRQAELDRKIATQERRMGRSLGEIELEHHVLQQSVEQVTAMVEACRKAHQRMAEGLARRKAAFRDIRDLTENNVNHRFGTFLRRRRMKGAIKMDYGERELSMEVQMEKGAKASTSDMKSLSGGERSFSTLAFILALGGEISAAFHCLDEFDVFLDVQNRLMSIKLLIEAARDWEGMQFILLTPQEVGAIGKAEADVREDSEQNGKKELPPDFVTIQQMASARVDRSHA